MTDGTIRRYNDGEVFSGVQSRRRWTPKEKVRIVEETYLPEMSVARLPPARHRWQSDPHPAAFDGAGALTAATAGEEVAPASE